MTTTHDYQNSDGKSAFNDADFLDWVAKLLHPEHAERVRQIARRMKGAQPTVAEHDRLRFQAAGLMRSTNSSDNRAGGALLTMLALHTPAWQTNDRLAVGGGRNPFYIGFFDGETPEERDDRLVGAYADERGKDVDLARLVAKQLRASREGKQMMAWTDTETAARILKALTGVSEL